MNKFVWLNPYLPQTLQISVQLAYFRVAFAILLTGLLNRLNPVGLLFVVGLVLGAFGIANLRWWGYIISLIFALAPFVFGIVFNLLAGNSIFEYAFSLFKGTNLISTIFDIAILALLIYPESRTFVKNNFVKTIP